MKSLEIVVKMGRVEDRYISRPGGLILVTCKVVAVTKLKVGADWAMKSEWRQSA